MVGFAPSRLSMNTEYGWEVSRSYPDDAERVHVVLSREGEEWPKSAPFFFSATLLAVLNPSFFWGVQMEFSIQNEINSFHLFCNTIRLL